MGTAADDLDPAAVLRTAPDVVWVEVDGEVVLYHAEERVSFVLDRMAALLWRCVDGSSPVQEILDDVAEAFGADRRAVALDCLPVMAGWVRTGLVETVNDD